MQGQILHHSFIGPSCLASACRGFKQPFSRGELAPFPRATHFATSAWPQFPEEYLPWCSSIDTDQKEQKKILRHFPSSWAELSWIPKMNESILKLRLISTRTLCSTPSSSSSIFVPLARDFVHRCDQYFWALALSIFGEFNSPRLNKKKRKCFLFPETKMMSSFRTGSSLIEETVLLSHTSINLFQPWSYFPGTPGYQQFLSGINSFRSLRSLAFWITPGVLHYILPSNTNLHVTTYPWSVYSNHITGCQYTTDSS